MKCSLLSVFLNFITRKKIKRKHISNISLYVFVFPVDKILNVSITRSKMTKIREIMSIMYTCIQVKMISLNSLLR